MIHRRFSRLKTLILFIGINVFVILSVIKFYKMAVDKRLGGQIALGKTPYSENDQRSPKCKPKNNVVFLKTHKTGSSTITNILSRYGDRHELLFVLPKGNQNRLGWPWLLQLDHVAYQPNVSYNILNSHARYNRRILDRLMPNDTVYVTILRDPVTQFESTFSYMSFSQLFGLTNHSDPLKTFFDNPKEVLINYLLTQDLKIYSERVKLIRNGMFFDLGLDPRDFENNETIDKTIKTLESEFHLVMIMEHFDESLVLLKRLLCWSLNDMLYFKLNARPNAAKRSLFSVELLSKIRSWSNADVRLYDYFRSRFLRKLLKQDHTFHREVKMLRLRNYYMREVCLTQQTGPEGTRTFVIRSNITSAMRRTCDRMMWDEVKYLRFLKKKQSESTLRKDLWFHNIPGYHYISSILNWL